MQEAWTLVQARTKGKRNHTRVPFQQRHRQGTTNQPESITVQKQQYVCHTKPRKQAKNCDGSQHPRLRRALAKLMLNTFWGKYGQQSNKTQVLAYGTDVSLKVDDHPQWSAFKDGRRLQQQQVSLMA